jgi:hypothetical protein
MSQARYKEEKREGEDADLGDGEGKGPESEEVNKQRKKTRG